MGLFRSRHETDAEAEIADIALIAEISRLKPGNPCQSIGFVHQPS